MVIVFRVDSSTVIGSGHLMRCLTLAKQMEKEDNSEIFFICRDLSGNMSSLVVKHGFQLILLPPKKYSKRLDGYLEWLTVSQEEDAEDTINAIRTNESLGNISMIVVDSYAIDITWERALRPYTKKIYVIDDLANRKHDCDIFLDQDYYSDKASYHSLVPSGCKMLLGHQYAPLRDEFYEAKKILRKRTGIIKNVLIFYGGSDITDETVKTIMAIDPLVKKYDLSVHVVVGENNKSQKKIKRICEKTSNYKYYCRVNNMAQLMSLADISFSAGGITMWECNYLELPVLVTAVSDNQIKICEECSKQGIIDYLGESANVTEKDIFTSFKKYLDGNKS